MTTPRHSGPPQPSPWIQRVEWLLFGVTLVVLASQLFGSHWRTAPSSLYLPLALVGITGAPLLGRRSVTAQWIVLAISVVFLVLSILALD